MTMSLPENMPVSEFRAHLADVLHETVVSGAHTYITRNGRRIAAVIPADEAEILDAAEDAYLIKLAEQAKANQGNRPYTPLADLLAEFADDLSGTDK